MAPIQLNRDEFVEIDPKCTLPPGSICKRHNPPPPSAFSRLVADINAILGPSSGIDSSDVDVHDLERAMAAYSSVDIEWADYAHADLKRNYTRNFVDHGNGKANLLILVWSPGKGSLIHDHAGAHCIMKVCRVRHRDNARADGLRAARCSRASSRRRSTRCRPTAPASRRWTCAARASTARTRLHTSPTM